MRLITIWLSLIFLPAGNLGINVFLKHNDLNIILENRQKKLLYDTLIMLFIIKIRNGLNVPN